MLPPIPGGRGMLLSKRFLGTHTHKQQGGEGRGGFSASIFFSWGLQGQQQQPSPPPPQPLAPAFIMPVSTDRSQVGAANRANPLPSGGEGGWGWRGRWTGGGQGGRSAAAKGFICISGPPATQGNPNTGLFSFFFSRGVGEGDRTGGGGGGLFWGFCFCFAVFFAYRSHLVLWDFVIYTNALRTYKLYTHALSLSLSLSHTHTHTHLSLTHTHLNSDIPLQEQSCLNSPVAVQNRFFVKRTHK